MLALLTINFARVARYLIVIGGTLFGFFLFFMISTCILIGTENDEELEDLFKMKDKKFMAHWYNEEEEVRVDGPIYAQNEEEAKNIAYRRYNGRGPAPLLWIEEVN